MALKDWKKVPNFDIWASITFKKNNNYIVIRQQYYSSNTYYWDVYLNRKKIFYAIKTKSQALKFAKEYMRTH